MTLAATHLIANDVFGADLIEVGYFKGRGAMNFDDHLKLWDILVANYRHLPGPRLLGGLGVSDSHSDVRFGHLQAALRHMAYLLDEALESLTTEAAVAAMRIRRMFFARYDLFPADGVLDFAVSTLSKRLVMGRSGILRRRTARVEVTMSPPMPGSTFNLVDTHCRRCVDPSTETNERPIGSGTQVSISRAKAFRIVVRNAAGQPIACTNHIVVLKP